MNGPVGGQAWARGAGVPGESERPSGVGPEEGSVPELPSEVAALRRIKFFEELTDADLSRLARIGQRRSYAAGDAIVERDSDRGGFFVLLSGEAEVEAGSTFHVLASGDFFGETALLAGSRRTATVRATEPVQVMVFEPTYFRPFLIENPSVAVTLLEVLADRLNAAQARLEADRAWI
jgi:CRP-like cAMP-binding protein